MTIQEDPSKSKKGRSKSEEKRFQIMAAASELFLEQGYENCSMEAIAKLAGVSKQTLYSHFGGKEQLFSDAVEATCQQYRIWDNLDASANCYDYLEAFCISFAELLVSREALGVMRVCAAEGGRSDVAELFWQAGPVKMRAKLKEFLSEQQRQGQLHFADVDTAASQLIAMLHGQAHTRLLLGLDSSYDPKQLSRYAISCAQLFYKAHQG